MIIKALFLMDQTESLRILFYSKQSPDRILVDPKAIDTHKYL